MKITLEKAKRARKLLRGEATMDQVIGLLGNAYTADEITAGIDDIRARGRANAVNNFKNVVCLREIETVRAAVMIPLHVIAERDHRSNLVPADTTAFLCGDPLPGYSARDKAPSIAPDAVHRDPLDALMFGRRRGSVRTGARFG